MKILQIFNHTRWRFAKKVNFFAYFCAGAQEWAPEQFDKVKVKLLYYYSCKSGKKAFFEFKNRLHDKEKQSFFVED